MWYAVETVFIDGKYFGSRICFTIGDKRSPVGHCFADHDEEPHNSCKSEFDNRIEIHVDWFETEDAAIKFSKGEITYIQYYDAYFQNSIKSWRTRYRGRKLVPVDIKNGFEPYKGIYEKNVLTELPWWLKRY